MKISLIVTSIDRQNDLDRFSGSIAAQSTDNPIEVIYIAQGNARLRFAPTQPANVQVIEHAAGKKIPLSVARNRGLRICTGEIIAFPDDDCWYEQNLLEKVVAYFIANPDVSCICTSVYDPASKMTLGRRPMHVTERVSYVNMFEYVTSAGIFVRRTALQRVGEYFNEELGLGAKIGAGEETELVSRMLSRSLTVEYVGTLQVFHPVLPSQTLSPGKEYEYNRGFGILSGWLIRDKHLSVAAHFMKYFARTCAATLLYLFSARKREIYWNRAKGMLQGVLAGVASDEIRANSVRGKNS